MCIAKDVLRWPAPGKSAWWRSTKGCAVELDPAPRGCMPSGSRADTCTRYSRFGLQKSSHTGNRVRAASLMSWRIVGVRCELQCGKLAAWHLRRDHGREAKCLKSRANTGFAADWRGQSQSRFFLGVSKYAPGTSLCTSTYPARASRFNPFDFRASCKHLRRRELLHRTSLNPFDFRASCKQRVRPLQPGRQDVSIPLTSGLHANVSALNSLGFYTVSQSL